MSKRVISAVLTVAGTACVASGWLAWEMQEYERESPPGSTGTTSSVRVSPNQVLHVSGSRIESRTLAELISRSQLIVVGTLLSEREEHIEMAVGPNGTARLPRVDLVRTFEIRETWKGSETGRTLDVRYTLSSGTFASDPEGKLTPVSVPWEVVPLTSGQTYVLFLLSGTEPQVGTSWGQAGEPGVASLSGTDLRFLTTAAFAADHNVRSGGDPGLAEPFNIDANALRSRIAARR